jgi:hypothetical protein
MTFKEQTFWCRKWGAVALLLGVLLVGMMFLLADNVDKKWLIFMANICIATTFLAAVLIFGGFGRPLHKIFYHYALEGNDRYRRYFSNNPMALWMWIDSEGRDRDA